MSLRAALLDVGGTLWPDRFTAHLSEEPSLEQLGRLLLGIDGAQALTMLRGELRQDDGAPVQDTPGMLAGALRILRPNSAGVDVVAVRRALCTPAVHGVRLFPFATELPEALRTLGLRCVIVSNVQVRAALEYWRDFADFGVAHLVDDIVTSLDVGVRETHRAFFEAAIRISRV